MPRVVRAGMPVAVSVTAALSLLASNAMNVPVLDRQAPGLDLPPVAEIDSTNVRIYYLSRSWACLTLVVVALIAAGVFLGRLVSASHPGANGRDAAEVLRDTLRERRPDFALAAECILRLQTIPTNLEEEISRSNFDPGQRALASALAGSLRDGFHEPNAQLLILAHQFPSEPGANACAAEVFSRGGKTEQALQYYQRELELTQSPAIRAKIVTLLAQSGDLARLTEISTDPQFAPAVTPSIRMKVAFANKDWNTAAKQFLAMQASTLRAQPLIMALTAGLAWLVIALHAGQPHHWRSFRMLAPLLATVLGVAGGFCGQFLTIAQKELFGLSPSVASLGNLGIYSGTIALRDTLLQLVLMLPFLPVLVARRSALDTLVVTGCVGLGFAIPETLEVCKQLAPADSLGRLLTSNFFHFAAAALIGLAVCRCLSRERGSFASAIVTIPAVILTQGVYDAFTRIPGAHVLVVLATIAFLILSRVFFIELRNWRDSFTDQCFLGATLVISLGALVATVLVAAATEYGFETASAALARNLPTLLMVSVVFFGQFKRGFAAIGSDLTTPSQK